MDADKIARGATSFFNEDLRILGGAYGRFLSNVQEARSQEKHQLDLTESYFSQVIGLFYGKNILVKLVRPMSNGWSLQ